MTRQQAEEVLQYLGGAWVKIYLHNSKVTLTARLKEITGLNLLRVTGEGDKESGFVDINDILLITQIPAGK